MTVFETAFQNTFIGIFNQQIFKAMLSESWHTGLTGRTSWLELVN